MSPTILLALVMATCTPGTPSVDDTDTPDATLSWFTTCGDPVCSGYAGPYDGIDACTSEMEGDACATAGAQCDFGSECNSTLICAEEDPKDQVGGCPISRLRYKTDVTYLDAAARQSLREEALAMRLATWRYKTAPADSEPRLGLVIDDHPTGPTVAIDGDHVDVYGLASLALAALQAQDAELQALKAQVGALQAQLDAQAAD